MGAHSAACVCLRCEDKRNALKEERDTFKSMFERQGARYDRLEADLNEALALLRNCNPEGEEEWRERRDLLLAKHDAKEGT